MAQYSTPLLQVACKQQAILLLFSVCNQASSHIGSEMSIWRQIILSWAVHTPYQARRWCLSPLPPGSVLCYDHVIVIARLANTVLLHLVDSHHIVESIRFKVSVAVDVIVALMLIAINETIICNFVSTLVVPFAGKPSVVKGYFP